MGNFLDPLGAIESGKVVGFDFGSLVAPVIGAVGSLVGSAASDHESSQTTSSAPAPRDADQTRFWNDFVNTWYGIDPSSSGVTTDPYATYGTDFTAGNVAQWLQSQVRTGAMSRAEAQGWIDKLYGNPIWSDEGGPHYGDMSIDNLSATDKSALYDLFSAGTSDTTGGTTTETGETTGTKSYKDMLAEDIGYQQAAGEEYLDTLEGLSTEKTTGYQTATDTYNTLLTDLLSDTTAQDLLTPVTLRFGGATSDVVPGSRRRAADTYTNILGQKQRFGREAYDTGLTLADTKYTTGKDLAGETRTQKQTYTPNAANIAYLTALMDVVNRQEDRRYKTPTTTTTAEASTDWGTEIANAINSGLDIYKAFK